MVGGVGMQQGGIGMMGHGDAPTKYEAVGGSMGSSGSVQQPIMWQGQQQEHQQARQQQQAQQPAVQQQQQHGVGMNQLNDILGALPAEVRAGLQQLQQQMPQGVQVQQVSSLQQAANNHQAIMEQMLALQQEQLYLKQQANITPQFELGPGGGGGGQDVDLSGDDANAKPGSRRDPIKRRQQNRLAAKRHRERVRARENQLEKEVSNLRLELQDANKQLMEARQETELAAIEANLRAKEAVQAATKAFLMLDKEKEKQKETAMDTDEKKSSLRSWGTVG